MAEIKIFNPTGLARPAATYSHVARAKAEGLVFIAGQVPTDASGATVAKGDFDAQCAQVFANIRTALHSVGADWGNVVQFMSFLVRPQDAAAFRAWRGTSWTGFLDRGPKPGFNL